MWIINIQYPFCCTHYCRSITSTCNLCIVFSKCLFRQPALYTLKGPSPINYISGNISIKDLIQIKDQPKRKLDQVIEVKDEKIVSKKQKLWIPDSELTTTDRSIIENG